jgi:hypothetical protein
VTEPSIIQDSYSIKNAPQEDWVTSGRLTSERLLVEPPEQLRLDLGDSILSDSVIDAELSTGVEIGSESAFPVNIPLKTNPAPPAQPQKRGALAEDLTQAQSLVQEQIERIEHLEQALDQSLASAAEMRLQLIHQQFLENQLASTEEIANIQQQAIAQLKKQLTQQKQSLEAQQQELQAQRYSFQELLTTLEAIAQGQPTTLDSFKKQHHQLLTRALKLEPKDQLEQQSELNQPNIAQSNTAQPDPPKTLLQPPSADPVESPLDLLDSLEPEPVSQEQAVTILQNLWQTLGDREASIQQLETELHRAHSALQEQQALINSLQQASTSKINSGSLLDKEFFSAHSKIQELETQLSKQTTTQTILQHTCNELEQTRDRQQTRIIELEHHTADIQEEILKQAQQASEYETAVQHWKDRYHRSKDYLIRFKELVEQFSQVDSAQTFSALSSELANLLAEIEPITSDPSNPETLTIPPALSTSRNTKMDLPDFLARRPRYRVRP